MKPGARSASAIMALFLAAAVAAAGTSARAPANEVPDHSLSLQPPQEPATLEPGTIQGQQPPANGAENQIEARVGNAGTRSGIPPSRGLYGNHFAPGQTSNAPGQAATSPGSMQGNPFGTEPAPLIPPPLTRGQIRAQSPSKGATR